jgi:hypothetical protein
MPVVARVLPVLADACRIADDVLTACAGASLWSCGCSLVVLETLVLVLLLTVLVLSYA